MIITVVWMSKLMKRLDLCARLRSSCIVQHTAFAWLPASIDTHFSHVQAITNLTILEKYRWSYSIISTIKIFACNNKSHSQASCGLIRTEFFTRVDKNPSRSLIASFNSILRYSQYFGSIAADGFARSSDVAIRVNSGIASCGNSVSVPYTESFPNVPATVATPVDPT